MAKYIKTYECGNIKNELIFNKEKYEYTMIEDENGATISDQDCFSAQMLKAGVDHKILDKIDVDLLDCDDEDGVLDILDQLEIYEANYQMNIS